VTGKWRQAIFRWAASFQENWKHVACHRFSPDWLAWDEAHPGVGRFAAMWPLQVFSSRYARDFSVLSLS